jgi:dolichol kinase
MAYILLIIFHGYIYISSSDINTEYGRDETHMLGTIAFVLYRLPFYILGFVILLIIGVIYERKMNKKNFGGFY